LIHGEAYRYGCDKHGRSQARERLSGLLDEAAGDHDPVLITGTRSNAVLVGEQDWNAIPGNPVSIVDPGHERIER